ncbi:MAG: prolyl oligopeptidase family serine peptidase [Paracoccaceae bacterium]|nr:prolyl oligopeptidase family serine peptidase [Paracoccaceae bacterium]
MTAWLRPQGTPPRHTKVWALVAALGLIATEAGAACGEDPLPCTLPDGSYHVALPPDGASPFPAVMFLHGFGGSGEGALRNTAMVEALLARGYAVIAPDGQPRPGQTGRSWDFHPQRPATRNEADFLQAVARDASHRFDLTRNRMILAGFSIGGSMVSYLACADPDRFTAYAPVAGSFWRPHPDSCQGPVRLLHTHGWTDQTVPLEGREIRTGFVQGDVFEALQIWRAANNCTALPPDSFAVRAEFQIRSWTRCQPGARIDFALHPGGHLVPPGWADMLLDWFEGLE